MDFDEFKKLFKKELLDNNIILENPNYDLFFKYMKGIIEWNTKINLTSINNEKEFLEKHYIDSLTINRFIEDKSQLIDIGTGAGFPGIPLKFVNPELNVTLIDSVNKKLNVIKEITNNLMMKKIEIIHSRAEDLANKENYRESFEYATTRAVSNLTTIMEYMLPFIKVNGKAICMKGPNIDEEIKNSKNAIEILGGEIENIYNIKINDEYERNIIIIKKKKNTPKQYPRAAGKPLKEPIK